MFAVFSLNLNLMLFDKVIKDKSLQMQKDLVKASFYLVNTHTRIKQDIGKGQLCACGRGGEWEFLVEVYRLLL